VDVLHFLRRGHAPNLALLPVLFLMTDDQIMFLCVFVLFLDLAAQRLSSLSCLVVFFASTCCFTLWEPCDVFGYLVM
jgi:hypothetical protein